SSPESKVGCLRFAKSESRLREITPLLGRYGFPAHVMYIEECGWAFPPTDLDLAAFFGFSHAFHDMVAHREATYDSDKRKLLLLVPAVIGGSEEIVRSILNSAR